jgi:hypothetical protein
VDKGFIKRSPLRFCLLILAPVLALALTTAGTAFARSFAILAEGGTTVTTGSEGDTGHIVIGGLVNINGTTTKSLQITIAYQDNFVDEGSPLTSFICRLTNPADLAFSGGLPVQAATLTISAGDTCFRTIDPTFTFSNVGKSLSFRSYTKGSQTRFKSTSSTLVNGEGSVVGNVAILGELEPSGFGSPQAGGERFITGSGGAVDTDDSGSPSGHMAMAGLIQLNPLKKGVTIGSAKAVDVTIDYEDFFFGQHLACHLIIPGDVSYTLSKGVGTLTLTVGNAGECDTTNTGKFIKFDLYVGGSTGRIVSTSATLVDSDGEPIDAPAIAGEFSTPGGS